MIKEILTSSVSALVLLIYLTDKNHESFRSWLMVSRIFGSFKGGFLFLAGNFLFLLLWSSEDNFTLTMTYYSFSSLSSYLFRLYTSVFLFLFFLSLRKGLS